MLQKLRSMVGEYYSGSLYDERETVLSSILRKVLARISIGDEHTEKLKNISQQGVVVHALKNKSCLNCLIIRHITQRTEIRKPVYCHEINMAFWQPFGKSLRSIASSFFFNPVKQNFLKRTIQKNESVIIYLRDSDFLGEGISKDPLIQLIEAQKEMDTPVFIFPELVAYGRRRERTHKSIVDLLFGQIENPGRLRRIITFLRFSKKAFVVASDPINLANFISENIDKSTETLSYILRKEIIGRIDEEKRAIVGPILKSKEEIIEMILQDKDLVHFMKLMAEKEKKNYEEIAGLAKKYLIEIAADYSESYIGFWDKLLTWLWNNIYDGVIIDKDGLATIRNISKKMPFVVIPCHRSHIDYLLLSYVFYHNNIQLPFIAAGNNLMFWPLGHCFRKSGAFFLRRSFKGNNLYGKVFAKYIKRLLEEGFPLEFFIEGGRSRTGKMVMPKYGLLSMVIQAFKEGSCENLAIIPTFIGYDRVIEEKAYLRELTGEIKEKENTKTLIKSRSVLKKRYGSVYLNVGNPLLLKNYLNSQGTEFDKMTLAERQDLYRTIGHEVVDAINKASVVSPFSLVATGLLCNYKRGISHEDLSSVLNGFYDYLDHRKVKFSNAFINRKRAFNDALELFESSGFISKLGIDDEDEEELAEIIYSVEEEKRLNLEYYKNNSLHFFVPLSFVAMSILSHNEDKISLTKIMEDYLFLKGLFSHEFIFDDNVSDAEEVNDVLDYLHERGMILDHEINGESWMEVSGRGRRDLMPFSGIILNYIESYWITLRSCSYLKRRSRSEKDFVKKIHKVGAKLYKKGEVSKIEALSQSNFTSALNFLVDTGVIDVSYGNDEKAAKLLFLREEDKGQAELLRRKLFQFM